jgi:putative addiction module component (TIGR02574 family)
MSEQVKSVMNAFLSLSEADRMTCWESLCETVSEQDDAVFAELERRRVEFESGRDPGVPMEEVFEKLLGAES